MRIYCTAEFRAEYIRLIGKNQYKDIEAVIKDYFIGKELQEVLSGTRLNNSDTVPFIKKRLEGKGGYRIYFLIIIKDENVYLAHIHPKTGPYGKSNIDKTYQHAILNILKNKIVNNDLFELVYNNDNLSFEKPKSNESKVKK